MSAISSAAARDEAVGLSRIVEPNQRAGDAATIGPMPSEQTRAARSAQPAAEPIRAPLQSTAPAAIHSG